MTDTSELQHLIYAVEMCSSMGLHVLACLFVLRHVSDVVIPVDK